jgi:hypothetical protein
MSEHTPSARRLSKTAWIIAYLISPAAAFVCLRMKRALSSLQCIFGVLAALLVHVGVVSVLIHTNGQPLQFFIVVLLSVSLYLIFFWQYVAGHSISLWSADAERQWRLAARFFGLFLAVGLAVAVLGFHLDRSKTRGRTKDCWQPPPCPDIRGHADVSPNIREVT